MNPMDERQNTYTGTQIKQLEKEKRQPKTIQAIFKKTLNLPEVRPHRTFTRRRTFLAVGPSDS